MMSNRSSVVGASALVAALALVLSMMLRNDDRHVAREASANPHSAEARSGEKRREHAMSYLNGVLSARNGHGGGLTRARLVEDIQLEKESLCVDEDLRVDVSLEPDVQRSDIVVNVNGNSSNPAIVSFATPGTKEVMVVAKDFAKNRIDQRRVSVDVIECASKPTVVFSSRQRDDGSRVVVFEIERKQHLGEKCEYEWQFGDGEVVRTSNEIVSYDYAALVQDSYFSSVVVALKAKDVEGNEATYRRTVSLLNIHYLSKALGLPVLPATYERFPARDDSGIRTSVNVNNLLDEDVTLESARLEFKSCRRTKSTMVERVNAGRLLSRTFLDKRAKTSANLEIPRALIPEETCFVGIELGGSSGAYRRVVANVFLDLPPKEGGRAADSKYTVVTDAATVASLNQAAKRLGKNVLTEEELHRLEKERMF